MTTNIRFPIETIERQLWTRLISEASYQIHCISALAEAHSLNYAQPANRNLLLQWSEGHGQ